MFEKQAQELSERFEARGYNKSWIKAGYLRAKKSKRDDLLKEKEKEKHQKPRDTQEGRSFALPITLHVTPWGLSIMPHAPVG